MKYLVFFLSYYAFSANLNLDPTYLNIKVYRFLVSTSALCTNPIEVINNASPGYVNVLNNPQLGNGSVSDGTYPCVMIEFSDNIKYAPNASSDSGGCVASTEYTLDVCGSGSAQTPEGGTVTCDSSENKVTMWLSTASTGTSGNSDGFSKPTVVGDSSNGFNLGNSLVVAGSSIAKFVVNGTDKVCDTSDGACNGNGSCEMQVPLFSFSQL